MTSANLGGPRGPWGQTGGAYSSAGLSPIENVKVTSTLAPVAPKAAM